MTPTGPNRKVIIITALVILVLLVAVAVAVSARPSKKAVPNPSATVQASATPDAVSKGPSMPTFAGFDNMQNYGVSANQIDAVKYGFFKYSKSTNKKISNVIVVPGTLQFLPHDRFSASMSDFATFTASLDGTNYPAKMEYSGSYESRLYLFDPKTSAQIYDSGTIDLYHGIGNND